jgi:hypothetical protein
MRRSHCLLALGLAACAGPVAAPTSPTVTPVVDRGVVGPGEMPEMYAVVHNPTPAPLTVSTDRSGGLMLTGFSYDSGGGRAHYSSIAMDPPRLVVGPGSTARARVWDPRDADHWARWFDGPRVAYLDYVAPCAWPIGSSSGPVSWKLRDDGSVAEHEGRLAFVRMSADPRPSRDGTRLVISLANPEIRSITIPREVEVQWDEGPGMWSPPARYDLGELPRLRPGERRTLEPLAIEWPGDPSGRFARVGFRVPGEEELATYDAVRMPPSAPQRAPLGTSLRGLLE